VFQYDFMQHALWAILLAAFLGGLMGYLILLRRLAFAAHGLGHISFTGATFALLVNASPMLGQFAATGLAAFLMGFLGHTLQKRDTAVAMVLAVMLGLGVLCLHYYVGSANTAASLLFGDVLGVSVPQLKIMLLATLLVVGIVILILRPLVFNSVAGQLASAKGVQSRGINMIFLLLVAIAVTLVAQVVGALLVFVLLVGPAAISLNWTRSFWSGVLVSIGIAIALGVLSLVVAFYGNLPVSVDLTGLVAVVYLLSLCVRRV